MTEIAIVWRGDATAARLGLASKERLRPVVEALTARGATVEPVVYRDELAAEVHARLLRVGAVLAWVDPIGGDEDRVRFDRLLSDLALSGAWVSAHPEVIAAMATKEVLFRTRRLGWGSDTHRDAAGAVGRRLPARAQGCTRRGHVRAVRDQRELRDAVPTGGSLTVAVSSRSEMAA